jgi:prevent-host-death family protein
MVRQLTATEAKAKLLSLLDEVEHGEEIEITRRGRVVARLAPARGPHALKGMFKGLVWTTDPDDDLYTTGVTWTMDVENLGDDPPP